MCEERIASDEEAQAGVFVLCSGTERLASDDEERLFRFEGAVIPEALESKVDALADLFCLGRLYGALLIVADRRRRRRGRITAGGVKDVLAKKASNVRNDEEDRAFQLFILFNSSRRRRARERSDAGEDLCNVMARVGEIGCGSGVHRHFHGVGKRRAEGGGKRRGEGPSYLYGRQGRELLPLHSNTAPFPFEHCSVFTRIQLHARCHWSMLARIRVRLVQLHRSHS